MIFSISSALDKAEKIQAGTFVGLNIWERQHVEKWVSENPEMLGEQLLILAIEFDRFVNSSDRLDLLALDRKGNLVVIELKRDSVAGYADLQAIRYAAMVSSMTIEKITPYYISYRNKFYGQQVSINDARTQITEFVGSEDFAEFSSTPRIILCSEGFSQEITTTVLWLREFEVDISCVKITPYKIGEKVVVVPKLLIPIEEAKQYQIDIKVKKETEEAISRSRPRTMRVIVENKLLSPGETIYLKANLPSWVHYKEDDPVFQATITGKLGQQNTVQWKKDGLEYSISNLTWLIFRDLQPEKKDPGGVAGGWYWVNGAGKTLWDIAEVFLAGSK